MTTATWHEIHHYASDGGRVLRRMDDKALAHKYLDTVTDIGLLEIGEFVLHFKCKQKVNGILVKELKRTLIRDGYEITVHYAQSSKECCQKTVLVVFPE